MYEGLLHARWIVQEEECMSYTEHFGTVGYEPEKMRLPLPSISAEIKREVSPRSS